jgi:alkylation response protein AidB-like acyl-CoA dehydrogenase
MGAETPVSDSLIRGNEARHGNNIEMELKYSTEDEAFRAEVREWLQRHLPETRRQLPSNPMAAVEQSRSWQRRLYEAGFVGIAWPREYGGRDASPTQQVILGEELARAGAPPLINSIGLGTLGPALILHGSDLQKARFLPRILTAEDLWCQGFSEPGAGSDLASLRTRAVADGDDFVVSGQKVWTSLGAVAGWCFVLARTNLDGASQDGISYFLMDMKSPGVTVVPIRQITGKSHFSELFLDNVRIPRANLVGQENHGWAVAKASLSFERSGLSGVVQLERSLARLGRLATKVRRLGEPQVRQRLAQLHIEMETLRYTGYRVLTQQLRGAAPGPEAAIGKLASSEFRLRLMDAAMELQGPYAMLGRHNDRALDRGRWQGLYLDARAYTIGGGTSEIMRGVVARHGLGLGART